MSSEFLQGVAGAATDSNSFDALHFFVTRLMTGINTATLVRVLSCTNDGGVESVGYVDVQPLVMQVAADGTLLAQPTVYQIPYCRVQGGKNAVILDPVEGDIGIAIFAHTDLSNIKATGATAGPGSFRRFDMADGMYVGGFINGVPNQYVQFLPNGGGINLVSPTEITAQAPQINLIGQVNQSGGSVNAQTVINVPQLNASSDVAVGPGGISTVDHNHAGVTTGTGTTGTMQN